ncbi:hypothetical protein HU200_022081 [Digitaria exilis]|uniref:DUF6598 domain-containing protein n=1 Tax=Digitaria exilis TaxID=1010633 RepID=A0A835C8C9_9POAL|nr:hypothetical protein HU200_022081 [Digitaria exilis]
MDQPTPRPYIDGEECLAPFSQTLATSHHIRIGWQLFPSFLLRPLGCGGGVFMAECCGHSSGSSAVHRGARGRNTALAAVPVEESWGAEEKLKKEIRKEAEKDDESSSKVLVNCRKTAATKGEAEKSRRHKEQEEEAYNEALLKEEEEERRKEEEERRKEKEERRKEQEAAYIEALRKKKERRDETRKVFAAQPNRIFRNFPERGYSNRFMSRPGGSRASGGGSSLPEAEVVEEESSGLEPFFFDEAEALAAHAAAEEKREEKRKHMEQEEQENALLHRRWKAHMSALDSIRGYDHKLKCSTVNRFHFVDLSTFDLDEECEYTHDRSICHLLVEDLLLLTGPKRGLALLDAVYFEMDLKIKGDQGPDKQLSKGFLTVAGAHRSLSDKMKVESNSLDSRHGTTEMMFAVVKRAVEATISIEVLQGEFYGEITACTTSIQKSLVLHDSKRAGTMTCYGKGPIQLLRPIVAVSLKEKLEVSAQTDSGKPKCTIVFTPRASGEDKDEITCGIIKMLVKVTWSIIDHQASVPLSGA